MKRILAALAAVLAASGASALDFAFSCSRTNVIYRMGETAEVSVAVLDGKTSAAAGRIAWQVGNFGDKVFAKGIHDVAKDRATLKLSRKLDRVGFTRFEVRDAAVSGKAAAWKVWGVACEPERIRPGAPCPDDFRAFWRQAVADYDAKVKDGVKAIPVPELDNAKRLFFRLEVPTAHGRTVYGFYSRPRQVDGWASLPLHVQVPGAGPSEDFTGGDDRAFCLFMNVHYYRPEKRAAKHSPEREALQKAEDGEWAAKFPMREPRYCKAGIAVGREDYFYYDVILAISRAVDWAVMQPGVDRSRILYSGTSQGGGFGLYLCGLNRHFTRATIFVPALTDLLGFRQDKRESGWPRLVEGQLEENRAAAERNAPYFDGVNFARNITFPIRYLVGGADMVCPPMAGLSAYNVTPSPDKAIEIVPGQGHGVSGAHYRKYAEWLMRKEPFGGCPDAASNEDLVDPSIGTSATGHAFPGPCRPFGLVQPSPDTGNGSWKYCTGYAWTDAAVRRFSQTHVNGTGQAGLGDVGILPFTGDIPDAMTVSAPFAKSRERIELGYYGVTLDNGVNVEIASGRRLARYRISFPAGCRGGVLLDFPWGLYRQKSYLPHLTTTCDVSRVSARRWVGRNHSEVWASRDIHYVVEFDRAPDEVIELPRSAKGPQTAVVFAGGSTVELAIAISPNSPEGAVRNFDAECGCSFDQLVGETRAEWDRLLSRIDWRCVPADQKVQASIRVIPACYLTGQAAGFAAAMSASGAGDVHGVDIRALQRNLVGFGAYLPNFG